MTLGDSATGRPESPRALRQLWRSIDFAASIAMAIAAIGGTMLTALDLALDIGVDLASPVSRDYFDRGPFRFNRRIESVTVSLQ